LTCGPCVAAAAAWFLLQGIPELKQLLAYTAADVVHYAVEE
jgi:hypothetical protein